MSKQWSKGCVQDCKTYRYISISVVLMTGFVGGALVVVVVVIVIGVVYLQRYR